MSKRELEIQPGLEQAIVRLRGLNVMLDSDLARLYEVETKNLLRAVKRNRSRFPPDFLLELSNEEAEGLRYQFGTSNRRGGRSPRHRREHRDHEGIRTARRMLDSNAELTRKLRELERRYDGQFKAVFNAIRQLMTPPSKARAPIGFR